MMADLVDAPNGIEKARAKRKPLTEAEKARMRVRRLYAYYSTVATESPVEREERLEKARAVDGAHRLRNRDKINARQMVNYHADLETARKRARDSARQRRELLPKKQKRPKDKSLVAANCSPERKITRSLRGRLAASLRATGARKAARSTDLLGCSPVEFREYLESRFTGGMCWGSYGHGAGKWHIDHRRPVCTFDLTDPAQQRACFHYTNMRPLWAKDNLSRPRKNWRPDDAATEGIAA